MLVLELVVFLSCSNLQISLFLEDPESKLNKTILQNLRKAWFLPAQCMLVLDGEDFFNFAFLS